MFPEGCGIPSPFQVEAKPRVKARPPWSGGLRTSSEDQIPYGIEGGMLFPYGITIPRAGGGLE